MPQSGAAKAQSRDRPVGQSSVGELLERGCTPTVAAQAVQLQGVVAGQQVGDGVQVNGGEEHRRPSVRVRQAHRVSLGLATVLRASLLQPGFERSLERVLDCRLIIKIIANGRLLGLRVI